MWKFFLLGVLVGGLAAVLFIKSPDQKITDANKYFKALRVSLLTDVLLDTCFFGEVDHDVLEERLDPLGYDQLGGSPSGSVTFGGGLGGGRLIYSKSEKGTFCSGTLNATSEPNRKELCEVAIMLHRQLRSHLRIARLVGKNSVYELKNVLGLETVQTYKETCAATNDTSPPFLWDLVWRDEHYKVSLRSNAEVNPKWFSYGGFSRAAGFSIIIRKRTTD